MIDWKDFLEDAYRGGEPVFDHKKIADAVNVNLTKLSYPVTISWEMLAPATTPNMVKVSRGRFWLWRRKVFVAIWSRVEDYGFRMGFLDSAPCYECGGRAEPTTDNYFWDEQHNG